MMVVMVVVMLPLGFGFSTRDRRERECDGSEGGQNESILIHKILHRINYRINFFSSEKMAKVVPRVKWISEQNMTGIR
jgi:hypothetical protein